MEFETLFKNLRANFLPVFDPSAKVQFIAFLFCLVQSISSSSLNRQVIPLKNYKLRDKYNK